MLCVNFDFVSSCNGISPTRHIDLKCIDIVRICRLIDAMQYQIRNHRLSTIKHEVSGGADTQTDYDKIRTNRTQCGWASGDAYYSIHVNPPQRVAKKLSSTAHFTCFNMIDRSHE